MPGETWPTSLAYYIRNNDQVLLQQADKVISAFEEELLPAESFVEFCDVAGTTCALEIALARIEQFVVNTEI